MRRITKALRLFADVARRVAIASIGIGAGSVRNSAIVAGRCVDAGLIGGDAGAAIAADVGCVHA